MTAKDTEVVPITDDKEKEFEEKLKIERKLNEYQELLRTKDTKLLVLEKEVHNLRKDLALKEEEILTSPQLLRSRKASVELDGNFNEDQIKSMKVRSHSDIIFTIISTARRSPKVSTAKEVSKCQFSICEASQL